MTLDEFVKAFAAEFDETPEDQFKADTEFKTLDKITARESLGFKQDKPLTSQRVVFAGHYMFMV